jgi:cytochrome c oxidase assembly protein subunit 15
MVSVLGVQIALGISNVVFSLPIAVAVAHNAVAVLLLLSLILINYTLYRKA